MRLISTEMLNEDMILGQDIYKDGNLLLKKGSEKIYNFVEYFKNSGIRYIYVEDKTIYSSLTTENIFDQTKPILMNTMDSFMQNDNSSLRTSEDSTESIINEVSKRNMIHMCLSDISTTDESLFSHCISTTIYALFIARELNYSREMLEILAMGTLLHDIGKIMVRREALFKKTPLTKSEIKLIKEHPVLGYDLLKNSMELPEMSKQIILLHHERLDGTGYPMEYKAEQLNELIKIVSIADVYDALTSNRCYRGQWSVYQTVNYLTANSGIKFDTKLVSLFIRQIVIFPNGSVVNLSDGRKAVVKQQNKNFPLRPIVMAISDRYGNIVSIKEINLLNILSLTIVDSAVDIVNK